MFIVQGIHGEFLPFRGGGVILGEVKARPKDIISFSLDYISKSKVQTSNPSSSPISLDTPARPADFRMPRYNRMSRDADSKGFKETWTAGLNRLGRGWFFSTKKPVIQLQVTRKPRKKTCLYVLLFFFSNLFRYFLI